MEMVQLSPLSAELLAFCNGRREVRQIVSRFADRFPILTGERARSAVVWGLRCLHKEGSIAILPPQGRPKRRIARTRRSQPCAA
jgi:hypothetical protein